MFVSPVSRALANCLIATLHRQKQHPSWCPPTSLEAMNFNHVNFIHHEANWGYNEINWLHSLRRILTFRCVMQTCRHLHAFGTFCKTNKSKSCTRTLDIAPFTSMPFPKTVSPFQRVGTNQCLALFDNIFEGHFLMIRFVINFDKYRIRGPIKLLSFHMKSL